MTSTPLLLLQATMGFICAFHLFMGTGLMFSVRFQRQAVKLYGAKLDWTLQLVYMVRILGSFAFILGVLALAATIDPLGNRSIIYGFILLFILRDLHRLMYKREIEEGFGISPAKNALTNIFFLAQTILMVIFLWLCRGVLNTGH